MNPGPEEEPGVAQEVRRATGAKMRREERTASGSRIGFFIPEVYAKNSSWRKIVVKRPP